jgi:hypothetical protein
MLLLNHQNNYIGRSSWLLRCQNFLQCSLCLNILHNNFDDPTKLFLNLYPAKFLDTSAKSCTMLHCFYTYQDLIYNAALHCYQLLLSCHIIFTRKRSDFSIRRHSHRLYPSQGIIPYTFPLTGGIGDAVDT